jgi:hypothetical protein
VWLSLLIFLVPGFFTFALGFVYRVFWVATAFLVLILAIIGGRGVWTHSSCFFGNEKACLSIDYANYTIEGMTDEQARRRADDYNHYPAADRNQPTRRWALLRTEMLEGRAYSTRQQCFGPIWPQVGDFHSYSAFETQCFDRQIIGPGDRSGEFLPPVEDYTDYPDQGRGPSRSFSHGDQVFMDEVQVKWRTAIGMFDRSAAGEAPTF